MQDNWPIVLRVVGNVAAAVLTPLVLALLGALFPPSTKRLFPNLEALRARNGWINGVACVFFFVGFVLPVVLLWKSTVDPGLPMLGVCFGGSVVLPYLWICVATLPFGLTRYEEFWRYYQLHYGIGIGGIMVLYVPCVVAGAISIVLLFERGVWRL